MNRRDDIKLPSGRIIRHVQEANGAQYAVPATGPDEMSELEWDEYCGIVAERNRKFFQRRRAMNDVFGNGVSRTTADSQA